VARYSRIIAFAALMTLAGCSLFRHKGDTPPQQFLSALKQGDGIQASRIWLHMSARDRANLSHGVGIKPQISPAEIQAQVLRHEKEKAAAEDADDSDASAATPDINEGDINAEMIDMPGLDSDPAGGLENLPNLPGASGPTLDSVPGIKQIE
jgi:hypothetical protein